ncbi:hypothetical protein [Hydrogenophaga sp.]|uniref:hypothetical protein n=1 Tax=Hydrogenophaga sp. TaxID=1904254 RepID=UPI0026024453|nr:hypothetical protein [Hydrogenophaga sp.]
MRQEVQRLSQRQVADGLLASLSTRRLDWRSALGSFSVAQRLTDHRVSTDEEQCHVCGLYRARQTQDLNVLNFERLKWGGVRHSDLVYALLELELFLAHPPTIPTEDDLQIFQDLMTSIATVSPSLTASALHHHFPASLKVNKAERDHHRFVDMAYPACWWNGSVGIHLLRMSALFGHVLQLTRPSVGNPDPADSSRRDEPREKIVTKQLPSDAKSPSLGRV